MHTQRTKKSGAWIFWVVSAVILLAPTTIFSKDSFKPFKFKTPEGSQKVLKDYLGKATLVTFFFPTCEYCNQEFPHLQKMYDQYKDQGLSAVAINIVPDQNPLIAGWQKEHQYTFPILIGATVDGAGKDYDLKMTPTHFLLDPQGKVLLKQNGYKPGDEKTLEEAVKKALSGAN